MARAEEFDQLPDTSGTAALEQLVRSVDTRKVETEEGTARAFIAIERKNPETGEVAAENVYIEVLSPYDAVLEKQAADIAAFRALIYKDMGDTEAEPDAEQALADMKRGVDMSIVRNGNGDVVAYGETELMPLAPLEGHENDVVVHDWLVGVHPDYRHTGLARETYARALKESIVRAYKRRPQANVVAITSQVSGVGSESFTHAIEPTYPFIVDTNGTKVEIKDPPLPQSSGSFIGEESKGKMYRWMIRFTDGRTEAAARDVERVLDAQCAAFADGEDAEYAAIVEEGRKFYAAVLAEAADGRVAMLSGDQRKGEAEKGALVEVEAFSEWLKGKPALAAQYAAIQAAVKKYDAKRAAEETK